MTEEEAVRRCKAGDREAFRCLVEQYQDVMYGTAYAMTGNRIVAEDQVQEAFIAAWTAIDGFHAGRLLKPWLLRILVNKVLSYRRANSIQVEFLEPDGSNGPGVEGPAIDVERRDQIRRAMAELPEEHRQVVLLRYLTGLSLAETAQALGRREGTVKSQAHRALERLRLALADGER